MSRAARIPGWCCVLVDSRYSQHSITRLLKVIFGDVIRLLKVVFGEVIRLLKVVFCDVIRLLKAVLVTSYAS